MTNVKAIVTIPPYADYINEVASHPLVAGFRLNTVMPIHETPENVLKRLQKAGKPIWVDLKGRQLRVKEAAIPPYTEVCLSHPIRVKTPVNAFFSDGEECVRVLSVKDNRLILEDGPRRLIGPGESVNIIDPSLEVLGTLTETDQAYLTAMKKIGLNTLMLSFVESEKDVAEVKTILPDAEIIQKIESIRGITYANEVKSKSGRLMAARGDLFIEVIRPHKIATALKTIIQADPYAWVASRLFDSLAYGPIPSSADIGDAAFLIELGYRNFMFGDVICLKKDTILEGLNLLQFLTSELL